MSIFVEEGKTLSGKNTCLAADSILLCCSERIIGSSVRNPCFGKNVTQLTTILLPTHLKENSHWGLCKIEVPAKSVFFDDGFYMKPPKQLDVVVKAVLRTLYSLSKSDIFDLHAWEPLQFRRFGMPDQPCSGDGSSSCGVAVLLASRSFFQREALTWSYKDAPYYRRKFLLEIILDGQKWSSDPGDSDFARTRAFT